MARYQSYAGDPYWITVRYPGTCAGKDCGAPTAKGDRGFYYPRGKRLYGERCGCADRASRDFESLAHDEMMASGGSY